MATSGKYERGAICLIVGEHPHYERNIGALITLTQKVKCPCGCGHEGWEYEAASRPLMVSFMKDANAIFPMHFVAASVEVDGIPSWPRMYARPSFRESFIIPIKGEGLDEEDKDEAPRADQLMGILNPSEHMWP